MTWILGVAAAIVAIVLLDVFFLAAMVIGHALNDRRSRNKWRRMPSRQYPLRAYNSNVFEEERNV